MQKKQVESLFLLAKIEILKLYELKNQYWPETPSYYETILKSPWWLVKTKYGNIIIGRRKRVVSIDWEDTPIRKIISEDDVTKGAIFIHAWTDLKCVEYLINLNNELVSIKNEIEDYTQHYSYCSKGTIFDNGKCTCGLKELLDDVQNKVF